MKHITFWITFCLISMAGAAWSSNVTTTTQLEPTAIPTPTPGSSGGGNYGVVSPTGDPVNFCNDYHIYAKLSLVSPYVDCLSTDLLSLCYGILLGCWVILWLVWLGNSFMHRFYKLPLHTAFSLLFFLKVLLQCFKFIMANWYDDLISNKVFPLFGAAYGVFTIWVQVALLLVVAQGWGITRKRLQRSDMFPMVVWSLLFALYYYISVLGSDVTIAFMVNLFYIIMFNKAILANYRRISAWITRISFWHLRPDPLHPQDIATMPADDAEQIEFPFRPKEQLFSYLRIGINLWLVAQFFANSATYGRLYQLIVREGLELALYVFLAVLFRLKEPRVFELKTENRYIGNGDPVMALRRRLAEVFHVQMEPPTPTSPIATTSLLAAASPTSPAPINPLSTAGRKQAVIILPNGKRAKDLKLLVQI